MSSVEITSEHFQSLEYLVQNVVLSVSLIWLHSLECRIDNKEMLQLEAYSGNMCVELFHVMNVGVDRATLSLHHEALFSHRVSAF